MYLVRVRPCFIVQIKSSFVGRTIHGIAAHETLPGNVPRYMQVCPRYFIRGYLGALVAGWNRLFLSTAW